MLGIKNKEMKNFKLYTTALLAVILLLSSCSKQFDEYSVNTNKPLSVPPYLLLRNVLSSIPVLPDGDEERWSQFTCRNYTYYGNNQYWTGSAYLQYETLNTIVAMEKEAIRTTGSETNPYAALAKFLKAYIFVNMSLKVGDLPMSEALQGLTIQNPKYDTQKQVFIQSLQLLEESNTMLSSLINSADVSLQGDIYFQEKISGASTPLEALKHWQRVVNSFKLRVLIQLSNVASDGDLKVSQLFSEVLSNPSKYPIMEGLSDNFEYEYNKAYNQYPNNETNLGNDATRLNLAATWENTLSDLHDLRAMKVGEPSRALGYEDTDYRSFVGSSSGLDISTMYDLAANGKLSLYNRKRYYDGFTAENTFIVGYPEVCFNIAEAINRGWVSGDAASYYRKGIEAEFEFYGVVDGDNTVTFVRNGATGPGDYVSYTVPFSFTEYFAQPSVAYDGNTETGLNQILTQKYLAFARNSGLEGYYQWRRTGVPEFLTGSGTGNSGVIPLRFQYPSDELSTNTANYNAAVQSQYGGDDNINAAMWILGR